jgi:hypothetical protein
MSTETSFPAPAPRRPLFFRCAIGLLLVWLLAGIAFAVMVAQGPRNEGWQWIFFMAVMGASAAFVFALCAVLTGISLARREPRRRTAIGLLVFSIVVAVLLKDVTYAFVKSLLH